MSGITVFALGLNDFCMLGVNGGMAHAAGQSLRPVNAAIWDGKGIATPAPLLGKLNCVCSVGARLCPRTIFPATATTKMR
jgi:hypothetical protein